MGCKDVMEGITQHNPPVHTLKGKTEKMSTTNCNLLPRRQLNLATEDLFNLTNDIYTKTKASNLRRPHLEKAGREEGRDKKDEETR